MGTVYEAQITAPDTGETITLSADSRQQLDHLIDAEFGVDQADDSATPETAEDD